MPRRARTLGGLCAPGGIARFLIAGGLAVLASACVAPREGAAPAAVMPTPLGGQREAPSGLLGSSAANNGCDEESVAPSPRGPVAIEFGGPGGERYRPRCVVVAVGTRVVFMGDFSAHPIVGGVVVGGEAFGDPSSEVPYASAGLEATFVPLTPGVYPFICQVHWVLGMHGAVIAR